MIHAGNLKRFRMVQIPMTHWSNLFDSQHHSTVKRLFLLTASHQPAKNIHNISIHGGGVDIYKWPSFYTLDYFSFKMAMDAVYIRMISYE